MQNWVIARLKLKTKQSQPCCNLWPGFVWLETQAVISPARLCSACQIDEEKQGPSDSSDWKSWKKWKNDEGT